VTATTPLRAHRRPAVPQDPPTPYDRPDETIEVELPLPVLEAIVGHLEDDLEAKDETPDYERWPIVEVGYEILLEAWRNARTA
jgi:hypothetical protein